MNTLLRKPLILFASLLIMVTVLILPQMSSARVYLSDGSNPGGPGGGGEGDPLDSNDYSGGGDDGAVHERRIIPRDFKWIDFDLSATTSTVMVRVEYFGKVPVFTFHVVNISDHQAEANHVR